MNDARELERENAALRDRLSRLSQASLRITAICCRCVETVPATHGHTPEVQSWQVV